MNETKQRLNLRTKKLHSYLMKISMTISLISSIILVVILYLNVGNYMSEKAYESAKMSSHQAVTQIEQELTVVENLLYSAVNNERIISNLNTIKKPLTNGVADLYAAQELKDVLFMLSNESSIIDSIIIFTENNQYSSSNTVFDYSFNDLRLNSSIRTRQFFTQEEYLKNVSSSHLLPEDIAEIHDSRLDGRLYFASNIITQEGHLGQLWILIDNGALTSNLLNGQQYNIFYKGLEIKTESNSIEATSEETVSQSNSTKQNTQVSIESEIKPFDLMIHFQSLGYDTIDLSVLIVSMIFVMCLLFSITYWLSKIISKEVLKPVTRLLEWINCQKKQKGQFDYQTKDSRSFSFRARLIGYFIITIFTPLLLTALIFYSLTYSVVTQELITLNSSEHHSKTIQINNKLNKVLNGLASYSINFNHTPKLTESSVKKFQSDWNGHNTFSEIDYIALYNQAGESLYSSNGNSPTRINLAGMEQINSKSRFFFYKFPIEEGVLITIKLPQRIVALQPDSESVNMVAVKVSSDYFSSLQNIDDATVEYISQNGETYWNVGHNGLNKAMPDHSYTIKTRLVTNELEYTSVYDLSPVQQEIIRLFLSQSYWLIIIMLIIIIISMSLIGRIMKPFSKIMNSFQENNKLLTDHTLSNIDEISELQQNFEDSIQQLNLLMSERIESQKYALKNEYDRREIQLFAMQNQVNPHFLYNSLDNLLFLVESKEEERAAMMINSLSHFFRYLTDRKHSIITLRQEVDFTQRYIEIMAVRFDNFLVEWDVNVDPIQRSVMKLTLQPLVENAIQHGAAHSDHLVTIKISIDEMDEGLRIIVSDDGLGIAEDKLLYIKKEIKESSYNKSGLFNVRDRLELYYGDKVVINVMSKIGEGTQIKIWIPFDIQ